MGYSTVFDGGVALAPPLNEVERDYLKKFSLTRHCLRRESPYHVEETDSVLHPATGEILERDEPGEGQPELYCEWLPAEDGSGIAWSGEERFYSPNRWMAYLIEHFLKQGAAASTIDRADPLWERYFRHFTFDHLANGTFHLDGEAKYDLARIVVENNVVFFDTSPIVRYRYRSLTTPTGEEEPKEGCW